MSPTEHIIGHIGMGFYGSNDPTNSVKALKEVVVRLTSPCCSNTTHNKHKIHVHKIHIHKNVSKHSVKISVKTT